MQDEDNIYPLHGTDASRVEGDGQSQLRTGSEIILGGDDDDARIGSVLESLSAIRRSEPDTVDLSSDDDYEDESEIFADEDRQEFDEEDDPLVFEAGAVADDDDGYDAVDDRGFLASLTRVEPEELVTEEPAEMAGEAYDEIYDDDYEAPEVGEFAENEGPERNAVMSSDAPDLDDAAYDAQPPEAEHDREFEEPSYTADDDDLAADAEPLDDGEALEARKANAAVNFDDWMAGKSQIVEPAAEPDAVEYEAIEEVTDELAHSEEVEVFAPMAEEESPAPETEPEETGAAPARGRPVLSLFGGSKPVNDEPLAESSEDMAESAHEGASDAALTLSAEDRVIESKRDLSVEEERPAEPLLEADAEEAPEVSVRQDSVFAYADDDDDSWMDEEFDEEFDAEFEEDFAEEAAAVTLLASAAAKSDDDAAAAEQPVAKDLPRVALMGEFSAGKSTLSNVLIGEQVLPVNVTATQLPPVWISFGEDEPYRVDLDGMHEPIDLDSLGSVSVKDTSHIRLFCTAPILKKCDIIDMPGISDPNMAAEVWQRVIHYADVVLWCTHATQAWRQSEAAVWSTMPKELYDRSLLLLTRIDKIISDRDRERVVRRVGKETDGLFREVIPVALIKALGAEPGSDAWIQSGADHLLDSLMETVNERPRTRQPSEPRPKSRPMPAPGVQEALSEEAPELTEAAPRRVVMPTRIRPRPSGRASSRDATRSRTL